jgi:arylsulfatase A-like enzyme
VPGGPWSQAKQMLVYRIGRFWVALALALALASAASLAAAADLPRPNILILTIDTLRADHMSAYGYHRETSPNLDRLMRAGALFTEARTVEPLTAPGLCAMLTSSHPHENGATRNGLRMRAGLPSLPKLLREEGYRTAAIVSNWTLRDKITGLAEHFDDYDEVLKRKRWFGLVSGEAGAESVTKAALRHLERLAVEDRPFFLWVHYIDPHAPYRKHTAFLDDLGIEKKRGEISKSDRYDTEIAYTDRFVAELLERLEELGLTDDTIIGFTSDHGESLGEHSYWGHGRHLYEPTLHIPMALVWPGRIEPQTVAAPALNIDLAPTIAGLLGLRYPDAFRGFDWTAVFAGAEEPVDRATRHQAHRGAVLSRHDSDALRRAGLLEVGVVQRGYKEIVRIKNGRRWRFDLAGDPAERTNLVQLKSDPTEGLLAWMEAVDSGLLRSDDVRPQQLDDETIKQLRALGYAD